MFLNYIIQNGLVFLKVLENAYSLNQLFFLFFLFSYLGWILEFVYRSICQVKLVNPGFLKGPIVPLYGFAGIFIQITLLFTAAQPILLRLIIYFTVITLMEFITGELLLRLFKKRFWDYSKDWLNFRGHICLRFSIAWTVLSLVFEKTLYPLSLKSLNHLNDNTLLLINVFVIFVLQLDFIYSSGMIGRLKEVAEKRFIIHQKERFLKGVNFCGGIIHSQNLAIKVSQLPIIIIKKRRRFKWNNKHD
ncbi:putative ABC transporter permease [bacterium]|nr:putative ABC transporter permease [bacterium]